MEFIYLLCTPWSIIDPRYRKGKCLSSTLGVVAQQSIGALCVGGVEEVPSNQFQVVLLSQGNMISYPGSYNTRIATSLSL